MSVLPPENAVDGEFAHSRSASVSCTVGSHDIVSVLELRRSVVNVDVPVDDTTPPGDAGHGVAGTRDGRGATPGGRRPDETPGVDD